MANTPSTPPIEYDTQEADSMDIDDAQNPPMHVHIHAIAGASTAAPTPSSSHHAWSSLQQRVALQHLAMSCHNAATLAKDWLLTRSPTAMMTQPSNVPLMPMLGSAFECLRRVRRLELEYVNEEHAMHLKHLTGLTSLSLGQVGDCAKVGGDDHMHES